MTHTARVCDLIVDLYLKNQNEKGVVDDYMDDNFQSNTYNQWKRCGYIKLCVVFLFWKFGQCHLSAYDPV